MHQDKDIVDNDLQDILALLVLSLLLPMNVQQANIVLLELVQEQTVLPVLITHSQRKLNYLTVFNVILVLTVLLQD